MRQVLSTTSHDVHGEGQLALEATTQNPVISQTRPSLQSPSLPHPKSSDARCTKQLAGSAASAANPSTIRTAASLLTRDLRSA